MLSVSFHLSLSTSRSISAPARKVSSTLPMAARTCTHSAGCRLNAFPPATPTQISTRATETPIRTDTTAASSAIPTQTAATTHVLSISTPIPPASWSVALYRDDLAGRGIHVQLPLVSVHGHQLDLVDEPAVLRLQLDFLDRRPGKLLQHDPTDLLRAEFGHMPAVVVIGQGLARRPQADQGDAHTDDDGLHGGVPPGVWSEGPVSRRNRSGRNALEDKEPARGPGRHHDSYQNVSGRSH